MKNLQLNFKTCLVIIFTISFVLTKAQTPQNITPSDKKGFYVSINTNGFGFQDPQHNQYMAYLVLVGETGIWFRENLLTGISFSTPWVLNNMGFSQSYTPFEGNIFAKYYPFEKKGLKWLGIHNQLGLANSGMNLEDPKEDLFTNLALGPSVNLHFGKSRFALNSSVLFNLKLGASALNKQVMFGQPFGLSGYIGISYTFKKRNG